MTEITNELIYEILKTIQAGQSETTRKIGSLAEALVRQTFWSGETRIPSGATS